MIRLNKKLIYIFVVLVAGLFVVGACQSEVGINPTIPRDDTTLPGGEVLGGGEVLISCPCSGEGECKSEVSEGRRYGTIVVNCVPRTGGCDGGCKDPGVQVISAD